MKSSTYNVFTIFLSILLTSILTASCMAQATDSSVDLPTYSKVFDDTRDPFKDAVAAIALAKATNRNVLIEIGGNWCSWCHKMDAFLGDNTDINQRLHSEFVLLKINVSDSNDNAEFMKSLPPVLGYPHMYVATPQGKMILSKDTAELLDNNEYSRPLWQAFIDQWQVTNNPATASVDSAVESI